MFVVYLWQVIGGLIFERGLECLIDRARHYRKKYGDSFVSVEHLVLGFVEDYRFGKQLFMEFEISLKSLKSAIEYVTGQQTVIDGRLAPNTQTHGRSCVLSVRNIYVFPYSCFHAYIYFTLWSLLLYNFLFIIRDTCQSCIHCGAYSRISVFHLVIYIVYINVSLIICVLFLYTPQLLLDIGILRES